MADIPELPNDTILDRENHPKEATAVLKSLYLCHPMSKEFLEEHTPTELIDSYEYLRRNGLLTIMVDQTKQTFTIKLTPTGTMEAVLDKLKKPTKKPKN